MAVGKQDPEGRTCRVCGAVLVQWSLGGPLRCPNAPSGHSGPGSSGSPDRARQPESFRRSGTVGNGMSIYTRDR